MRVSSTDALARAVVAGAAAGAWKAAAEPARRARTTFCCDGDWTQRLSRASGVARLFSLG